MPLGCAPGFLQTAYLQLREAAVSTIVWLPPGAVGNARPPCHIPPRGCPCSADGKAVTGGRRGVRIDAVELHIGRQNGDNWENVVRCAICNVCITQIIIIQRPVVSLGKREGMFEGMHPILPS